MTPHHWHWAQSQQPFSRLLKAEVKNDTFFIQTDSVIASIRFIGQEGKILKELGNSYSAFYDIKPEDTYVRSEIAFNNKVTFYLNPICRYDGDKPASIPLPVIDYYRTWLLRIIGFATIIFIFLNIIWIRKRIRKSKKVF